METRDTNTNTNITGLDWGHITLKYYLTTSTFLSYFTLIQDYTEKDDTRYLPANNIVSNVRFPTTGDFIRNKIVCCKPSRWQLVIFW